EAAPADLDEEERRLRRELAQLAPHQRRRHLLPLLAPQRHWTPLGLLATRLFSQDLGVAP
ncbi:iron-containing redox enzyme family protein, partial [Pseudomonas citronellolis]|nr:iron-containing redox enzyme family protein [Pseudomonas citronellolis]